MDYVITQASMKWRLKKFMEMKEAIHTDKILGDNGKPNI